MSPADDLQTPLAAVPWPDDAALVAAFGRLHVEAACEVYEGAWASFMEDNLTEAEGIDVGRALCWRARGLAAESSLVEIFDAIGPAVMTADRRTRLYRELSLLHRDHIIARREQLDLRVRELRDQLRPRAADALVAAARKWRDELDVGGRITVVITVLERV